MDKGKIVRLVLIPIVLGLVVTLIVRQLLSTTEAAAVPAEIELTPVVVIGASQTVPARVKLTEQHLVVKQLPKAYLTGQEFGSVSDLAGQISLIPLEPGAMVLSGQVVPEGQGRMPFRIPEGKRAVTIRIDELTGVAGHPEPGDLVDLVLVLPAKDGERPDVTSRVLFEAVQVLGKGPAAEEKKDGSISADGPRLSSLTLALSPLAATEVALAEQVGHIKVLLRPALAEPEIGRRMYSEGSYSGGTPSPPASH